MDIQGLQKLTLLDWPGRVACTIFLGGCDFRCPFCHNRDLVTVPLPAAMDSGELLAFLAKRKGLLDGVCVTGGEPLLRPGLEGLLEEIKALGFPIKLDTNGSHPQLLARLWSLGLVDYAAMDIKNSPERYGETAGVPGLDLGPSGRACPGCWRAMWTMSSAPPWCASSMTAPPSAPSAPGSPAPGGTFFRPSSTGTPCSGPV